MTAILVAFWLEARWEAGGYVDHTTRRDMIHCGWCCGEYALD